MDLAQLNTIDDVQTLRGLVAAEKVAEIAARDKTIRHRDSKIEQLTHEITRLRRVQFAARSEKLNPEQLVRLNEALAADLASIEAELDALRGPDATGGPDVAAGSAAIEGAGAASADGVGAASPG
jgi:hypothetical protein